MPRSAVPAVAARLGDLLMLIRGAQHPRNVKARES
jgi:hypothetical protein